MKKKTASSRPTEAKAKFFTDAKDSKVRAKGPDKTGLSGK